MLSCWTLEVWIMDKEDNGITLSLISRIVVPSPLQSSHTVVRVALLARRTQRRPAKHYMISFGGSLQLSSKPQQTLCPP